MPYVEHGSIRLFYTSHGALPDAPCIVLLHGWACDAHDWSHQITLLTGLGFRVVALDLRGHGRSSAPASISDYSMKAFAEDVFVLLHNLQIGPAIIMAHSMSTIIASILAVEHQDIVEALILVHPIYCGTPPTLATMSERMCREPDFAPYLVAEFFERHMYTAQTPGWLKTWHTRRILGTDGVALAGCGQAIVDLFESIVGQTDTAKAFMRKRAAPRFVITTNTLPAAAAWEAELGLEGLDECHTMNEGTFSHFVDSERFNDMLKAWLVRGRFTADRRANGDRAF
ncbi:alpha/beta hydrolase fold [Paraphaeosphaeria sporulosa]